MARPKKKTTAASHLLIPDEPKTEWQKILAHVEDNIKLYAAGIVFIIICIAIGALIRITAMLKEQEVMTAYTEAVIEEDAAKRLEKLESIVGKGGKWTPEILYMTGETSIEVNDMDKARQSFEKIIAEYGKSEYTAKAKDGLAYIDWNSGRLEEALAGYDALIAGWPGEFTARRAHVSMGQILEELERPADAIAAYKKQISVFPESTVAAQAQKALDRLKEKHPDLFTEETDGEIPGGASGTDETQTGVIAAGAQPASDNE